MAIGPRQHRVILHLHQGAAESAIVRAAAELAQMLGIALHGVFVQDEALSELAALPFIREFRLGTGAWQPLDRQRLAEEQRSAAAEARRLLDEAAAALGVTRLFEIIGGDPALFIAATSQAGDIIVVAQPRLPAERLVHATARWLEAAHGCAASVMLVPQVMARRAGPVAAVVCAESDPAIGIAARIAAAAGEPLLLLVWGPSRAGRDGDRNGARRRSAAPAYRHPQHPRRDAGGRRAGAWREQRASGRAGARCLRRWTMPRCRRISRRRAAFPCWWWNRENDRERCCGGAARLRC